MKRQFLKMIGISFVIICFVLTLIGSITWAEIDIPGDNNVTRNMQEYYKRIVENPFGTWIEYGQRTSLEDLILTGTYYPEISYRVYMPNMIPNWWGSSSEYNEYSRIGGIGGIKVSLGLWDLIGIGTGGMTGGGIGGIWPGGYTWPSSSQVWNTGGSSWLTGGWPWNIGSWSGGYPVLGNMYQ